MKKLETFLRKNFAHRLFCKNIIWTNKLKIFCDGGWPIFRWIPRFYRTHYHEYWGMSGCRMSLWGREIWVCIGEDKNGLYK